MAIRIEEGSRLDRSKSLGVIHTGRRIKKGDKLIQDTSFKSQPRFWVTIYNPALKFGEVPDRFDDVMDLAIEQFAGGDEKQLTELPILLRHSTAERNFRVGKKRFPKYRVVDCYSDNPRDCGNESDGHPVNIKQIEQYKTPTIPINALNAETHWMHFGDIAHRTMDDGAQIVVPCPQDPRDCPFASHTGKKNEIIYDCKMRGILYCSFELWYPRSINHQFELWTSSWASIRNIANFLNNAEIMWSRFGLDLSMITLRLCIRKGTVRTPDGQLAPQPELYLKYDGQFQKAFHQLVSGYGEQRLNALQTAMQKDEVPRALPSGAYAVPSPEPEDIVIKQKPETVQKQYGLKPESAPAKPKPKPKPEPKPQKAASSDELSNKEKMDIKKLAEKAGRLDEFLANQNDAAALRQLEQSLGSPEPPTPEPPDDVPPSEPESPADSDDINREFKAFCDQYRDLLQLPPQNDILQTMLLLEKRVKEPTKLTNEQIKMFYEEFELMKLFVEHEGTLEKAMKITGNQGFQDLGWLAGGFISHRKTVVNQLVDAANQ